MKMENTIKPLHQGEVKLYYSDFSYESWSKSELQLMDMESDMHYQFKLIKDNIKNIMSKHCQQ